ncbi:hypothetical protein RGQ13_19255 [Thalassotalea psychrophila]|uniref:Uncharacterized protein n=1 Tax=Thalassotalea psychrophila TaxID=3065647 RepID=A0ABY9TUJ0_9GAMM|nr:hypothetical protein RGQ13_19255 [Colwelliaceae bacterium SQ149]
MKLIMRSEFDNLRLNNKHSFEVDNNTDKQVVKIYCAEILIAKRITQKKSIRYFGIKGYKDYLTEE